MSGHGGWVGVLLGIRERLSGVAGQPGGDKARYSLEN
jgi:hypothetical protein